MGYRNVMVGTDGSETATLAVRAATGLAKRFGATVHIVCAHDDGGVDEQAAIEVLRYARDAVRREGVDAKTHMRKGPAAEAITQLAELHGIDVIVVGNVGMGKARRFRLGGIAEEIAHQAPCDVLIVHTRDRDAAPDGAYRHVLVGTDGSATASEAARKGFELAEILGAEVTLVHVGDPLVGAVVLDETERGRPGTATVHAEALEGEPAERITERAGRGDIDLVVVGNKGMAGARRYLLGSVPAQVAHESPIDVLIAKTVGRSIDDLAPGHGGLVDVQGRRLAVYRADDGTLIVLSPRCQHMGCTVDWNDADGTWDCPCHGSRYRADGEVFKGPAKKDLDREQLPGG
jgi:nucleotide-binding universal stress UspA family protein/nitrite reductase/ring-hydroxylating ferredoxin subunit